MNNKELPTEHSIRTASGLQVSLQPDWMKIVEELNDYYTGLRKRGIGSSQDLEGEGWDAYDRVYNGSRMIDAKAYMELR